jgi:DNA-binding CsgD family transcriptional regulator
MITLDGEIRNFEPHRGKQEKIYSRTSATTRRDAASQPPELSEPIAQATLRAAAIAADQDASSNINLSLLWRELARGTSRIEDGFFSGERCYLIVSLKTSDAVPIEGRRLEILETVLGGSRQKNIAIDLRLAPSTIALNSRLALLSLGVTCKPSRAHPLLMLAARAVSEPTLALARSSMLVTRDQRELRVVGIPRPDQCLQQVLPPAELAVIRLLVEGLSYREIAQVRGTAMRTVANQITAVFRRLNVSGRNELVQRLFFEGGSSKPPPRANAETLAPPDTVRATPAAVLLAARRSA